MSKTRKPEAIPVADPDLAGKFLAILRAKRAGNRAYDKVSQGIAELKLEIDCGQWFKVGRKQVRIVDAFGGKDVVYRAKRFSRYEIEVNEA